MRDQVILEGVVIKMADILDQTAADSNALRNVAWCLSNFMKGDSLPPIELNLPAIPSLVRALQRSTRNDIINDIIWGLSFGT